MSKKKEQEAKDVPEGRSERRREGGRGESEFYDILLAAGIVYVKEQAGVVGVVDAGERDEVRRFLAA